MQTLAFQKTLDLDRLPITVERSFEFDVVRLPLAVSHVCAEPRFRFQGALRSICQGHGKWRDRRWSGLSHWEEHRTIECFST